MNSRDKIIFLVIIIVVLAAIAAAIGSLSIAGASPERQTRVRWGLSRSQLEEIRQIMERYRRGDISPIELEAAVLMRFREWGFAPPPNIPVPDLEIFYTVKSVISTVNIVIVAFLLLIYLDIYRKTNAQFALGLIIFSLILLFYTISSNPFIQILFGFRAIGLGPFAMLPDAFALIALVILLYLSLK
ncbi:MAG: hypothetical protein QXJ19_05395 [Candidatus Bathyarchaeia archaeon]|nr:hypothetical protein [Candidatus Bathyarchaeota archaeon]